MADMVQQEIRDEIQAATFFSLLVDESKDVSSKEQISFVLRYLYDGMIFEEFIAIHPATSGLTADALSESILKAVGDLGVKIKDCDGQGYDGASVMSGQVNGVSTIISENAAPMACYIHCFNHRLNLVIVDSLKNVPNADDFLILLQKLYAFVSGSAVHIKWVDM